MIDVSYRLAKGGICFMFNVLLVYYIRVMIYLHMLINGLTLGQQRVEEIVRVHPKK
jgi:hypothetical protein